MEMANCRKCRKIYARIRSQICPECEKEEEQLFSVVQDYLRDNPKAPLTQVAEATGVSAKKIMNYLREGRIEVAVPVLQCDGCGTLISTGKLCEDCQKKVASNWENMASSMRANIPAPEAQTSDGPKVTMHTRKK
ncbi:MAG: MerR family transcriptional regulator [Defluviitaleaceae bacterium]|nr:MerR family transcriptional regulator [Defluviitaleaceae bacterium]